MMDDDDEERRRQNREAFAKMYLEGEGTISNESFGGGPSFGAPMRPEDELNLESIHFAPDKYVVKLLKEKSLKGLMHLSQENTDKAKELDNELQSLVYANYNRFISATETIRKMKENVVRMDEKLHMLEKNVDAVDGLTKTLNTKLQTGRTAIEQKVAVSRMMKQIQFLIELPQRIRQCMKEGSYAVGAKYWAAGDNILHRHSNIASFKTILDESKSAALELQNLVLENIRHTSLDGKQSVRESNELFDTLRALRQTSLGAGCSATDESKLLMDPIQSRYDEEIKGLFREFQQEFAFRVAAPPNVLKLQTKVSTRELLERFGNAMQVYHTQMTRAGEMFARGNKEVPVQVRKCLHSAMSHCLELFAKQTELVNIYRMEKGLCNIKVENVTANLLQEAVEMILFDVKSIIRPFREMSFAYLGDSASDFIVSIEKFVISIIQGFLSWVTKFTSTIDGPKAHTSLLLSSVLQGIHTYGVTELRHDGIDLSPLKTTLVNGTSQLIQLFVLSKGRFCSELLVKSMNEIKQQDLTEPKGPSPFIVVIANELHLSKTFLTACIKDDPKQKQSTNNSGKASSNTGSNMGKAPSKASTGSDGSSQRKSSVNGNQPLYARQDRSLATTMEKIFTASNQQSPQTLTFAGRRGGSPLDSTMAYDSLLLYVFKSFAEILRSKVLRKFGFHQIQVDVEYISSYGKTMKWLPTGSAPHELLLECLRCAYERCIDRVPMTPEDIATIVTPHVPAPKTEGTPAQN